jgi:phosphatidylglycerophosphate synthase
MALVALSRDHVKTFAVLWALQGFWDCADGYYARKYGMVTSFGDAYDHATDIAAVLALVVMVHRKYDVPPLIMAGFVFALACNAVFVGCQQKYYARGSRTESLDSLQAACPDTSWLPWTRWLAHGTFHALLVLVVVYCDKYHRRPDT